MSTAYPYFDQEFHSDIDTLSTVIYAKLEQNHYYPGINYHWQLV